MFGPAGLLAERVMRREVRQWQRQNPGGQFWLIRPNHAIAALARLPNNLFDLERAKRCKLGCQQVRGTTRGGHYKIRHQASSTMRAVPGFSKKRRSMR